ncbi:Rhomboid domain containing protein 3 [Dissostichus eleginoides]|uniref:Rhomboid domain containing protein 3 n=1 Tax=Dissostichus eleginoides TaxID=100907 RepID=A0AAD9C178_DISEL|nr:Rhomboid domain containing protein 3 [Dissostichus eleginoides]
MPRRLLSVWFWFGSDRGGFCLGTCLLTALLLLMYAGGIQASLSLGPGGEFPRVRDVFLYALSHDDLPSLLVSVAFLLVVGPCQERRWGTVAFLSLSTLTSIISPLLYTLVLCVGGSEASRICGHSAIQLALFTAQCRQVAQRRLLRILPVWLLPWLLLLMGVLLLPGTPALLHFCTIFIGHNYHQSFIGMLQELEEARLLDLIPDWAYIRASSRLRLPTYTTSQSSRSHSHMMPADQAAAPPVRDPSGCSRHPDAKVEVPKSSVSSLRLQQLEKMGFPTEKAVVALAASKQLDGAISLLIDDSVGEQAVMVSKGKQST